METPDVAPVEDARAELPEPLRPDPSRQTTGELITCPDCGRTFTSRQGYGRHRTVTHGDKPKKKKPTGGAAHKPKQQSTEALDASLLKALYPTGSVPLAAMPRLQAWLEEAHRLRQ